MPSNSRRTVSVPSYFLGLDDTEYSIEVHQPTETSGALKFRPDRADKKFTVRLKKCDLILLDAIAAASGFTRSTILNKIVHDLLMDELLSVKDLDARALIAAHADQVANQDDSTNLWIDQALSGIFDGLINNIVNFNVAEVDYLPDEGEKPLLTNSSDAAIEIAKKLGYK